MTYIDTLKCDMSANRKFDKLSNYVYSDWEKSLQLVERHHGIRAGSGHD